MLEHSGFLQEAVQVGDQVISVVAVYEPLPTVVHKPALHLGPSHAVGPVVLLQPPVGKRTPKVKVTARQEDNWTSVIQHCSAKGVSSVSSTTRKWKHPQNAMDSQFCIQYVYRPHTHTYNCGYGAFCWGLRCFYRAYPRSGAG